MKRIFLIVLDSVGIGAMADAVEYGDVGTNTLKSASTSSFFHMPNMKKLGLFNVDGIDYLEGVEHPLGTYARMIEVSKGKDTTIGHWEIAGIHTDKPLPTFPDGFPQDFIDEFSKRISRGCICNKSYSGTEVMLDYGDEHMETGKLIVYTSADSVFQIAAHEDVVSVEQLYEYCHIAREMLTGDMGVGRVIARPFQGTSGHFERTSRRHDYSLVPSSITMMEQLQQEGYHVIGIGKINDIFAGIGISEYEYTVSNVDGIKKMLRILKEDFEGLCFVNLVDFDMAFGHRNDVDGYAKSLSEFDEYIPQILELLKEDDLLMITADHGCDPGYACSTDHSREHTPFIMYGKQEISRNLGTRNSFSDIGATVLDYFEISPKIHGTSMLKKIKKFDTHTEEKRFE